MALIVRYNEEKGKTYGMLKNTKNDFVNCANKLTSHSSFFTIKDSKKLLMNGNYHAEATRSGEDEFDEEVGRAVVKEKILTTYRASFDRKMRALLVDALELVATLADFCLKHHIDVSDIIDITASEEPEAEITKVNGIPVEDIQ